MQRASGAAPATRRTVSPQDANPFSQPHLRATAAGAFVFMTLCPGPGPAIPRLTACTPGSDAQILAGRTLLALVPAGSGAPLPGPEPAHRKHPSAGKMIFYDAICGHFSRFLHQLRKWLPISCHLRPNGATCSGLEQAAPTAARQAKLPHRIPRIAPKRCILLKPPCHMAHLNLDQWLTCVKKPGHSFT